jgi:hypothetical protein
MDLEKMRKGKGTGRVGEVGSPTGTAGRGGMGRPPAADLDPKDRPGVPMYGNQNGGGAGQLAVRPPLDQQPQTVPILIGVEVDRLTPVFGTSVPPKGLSGIIRRFAYSIPEHKAGRWMMLMLGDRVDVLESRIGRNPIPALGIAVGVIGLLRWRARRRAARRLVPRGLLARIIARD